VSCEYRECEVFYIFDKSLIIINPSRIIGVGFFFLVRCGCELSVVSCECRE
jgi:hypothetical protein